MINSPVFFIAAAFLAGGVFGQEGREDTCGPFQLTTTSGTLYSGENGKQVPGSTTVGWEIGEYLITDNGTLTNSSGYLCEFREFLSCDPNNTRSNEDGAFVIGEYGRLSYANNDTFNACSPIINNITVIALMRIYPAGIVPNWESLNVSCSSLAMQASRCHPGENDTNANTTGGTNDTNSTGDAANTSGAAGPLGLGTLLFVFLPGLGLAVLL
ncbi:hypothetical protein N8I77_009830 [Diaporthe amygdali]|uniref:Uncharacterized protein n=1 Tax=Phomopsis amygdali TaxID=1214568 RepID=A0AAD9W1C6_PHOAM|nr:hypothetical protein N8I77_009830 [Diaporthe amygdali]